MGFAQISIDKYIKKHLASNPDENEKDLRERLNSSLSDYQKGVKCHCGKDIWVIGSAAAGNSCFTCITGESYPDDDYEIDSAMIKKPSLCLTCLKNDNPDEEILCHMTRYDQRDENDFICFAYLKQ